jgi:hypothetical protein
MNGSENTADSDDTPDEKNPRDRGYEEVPAPQGLKKPPTIARDEDSGEWTRGGGTDPNEPGPSPPSKPPKRT